MLRAMLQLTQPDGQELWLNVDIILSIVTASYTGKTKKYDPFVEEAPEDAPIHTKIRIGGSAGISSSSSFYWAIESPKDILAQANALITGWQQEAKYPGDKAVDYAQKVEDFQNQTSNEKTKSADDLAFSLPHPGVEAGELDIVAKKTLKPFKNSIGKPWDKPEAPDLAEASTKIHNVIEHVMPDGTTKKVYV